MPLVLITYISRIPHTRAHTYTHVGVKVWRRDGTQGRWHEAMCHHPLEETPDTRAVGADSPAGRWEFSSERARKTVSSH